MIKKEEHFKRLLNGLKEEANNKKIIYISISKPCQYIFKKFAENNINIKNLFVIGCDAKSHTEHSERSKQILCVESPSQLTYLSLAISNSLKYISGEKIILVDGVDVLKTFNDEVSTIKFIRFTISNLLTKKISAMFLVPEDKLDDPVIKYLLYNVEEVEK